jgi:hypothetical protein
VDVVSPAVVLSVAAVEAGDVVVDRSQSDVQTGGGIEEVSVELQVSLSPSQVVVATTLEVSLPLAVEVMTVDVTGSSEVLSAVELGLVELSAGDVEMSLSVVDSGAPGIVVVVTIESVPTDVESER